MIEESIISKIEWRKIIGNKSNSQTRVREQLKKWEEVSTQVADFISWLTYATNNHKEGRQLMDQKRKIINKIKFKKKMKRW